MNEKAFTSSVARPETRLQKSLRSVLRWVLGALLAFGLGALFIAFALYLPSRQKLDQANSDLERANGNVTTATDQITALQADNKTLKMNLDTATLHVYVLKALSDVRSASLAATVGDFAGTSLSLNQASAALNSLSVLLGGDHKDEITAMQKSAAQALINGKTDLKSTQSELDQLIKNLVQLEDDLFPTP